MQRERGGGRETRRVLLSLLLSLFWVVTVFIVIFFYFSDSLGLELLLDCSALWMRRRDRRKEGRKEGCVQIILFVKLSEFS